LTPLGEDDEQGRSGVELTNVDVVAKLSSKLYDWASVSYEYKAKNQPQLLDKWQIQHLLVLNFTHTVL
jgi:hypothetical protein